MSVRERRLSLVHVDDPGLKVRSLPGAFTNGPRLRSGKLRAHDLAPDLTSRPDSSLALYLGQATCLPGLSASPCLMKYLPHRAVTGAE